MVKGKYSFFITLTLVCILSFLSFTILYFTDNKYNKDKIHGYGGYLDLSQNNFNKNSVVHLCYGWDVYPQEHVPYDELSSHEAPLNIFIGQYSGMDFGKTDIPYFGKATYHLKISLPEAIQSYTLEIPEIFSSYELYINGNLLSKCGNIDSANYAEATKNSSVSFLAKDSIDITLYVSNYSHIYGGLVYPPAFGTQEGVFKIILTRIIFTCMAFFISLTLCIFFLLAGLRTNKTYAIYSLLTLIFIGYTNYTITHSIFTTPIWIYHIEIFCYYFFITLILYIQKRIFNIENEGDINHTLIFRNDKIYQIFYKILLMFSLIILVLTLTPAKFICMNSMTLKLYSSMLSFYKYSVFIYLIITTFKAALNNVKYSKLLSIGFCIVATSFLADRIFKLFEPIRFAWFYEFSGFLLVCIIGLILILTFSEIYIKNQKLNMEIEIQKSYYKMVNENIYNTRKMRHNLKNHILVIKSFLEKNDIIKLNDYIKNYAEELPSFNEMIFCQNEAVNVLFSYYVNMALQDKITVNVINFNIPQDITIASSDLCVILGNLFTNAIEACKKIENKERIIKISSKVYSQKLSITFDNTYKIEPVIIDQYFLSSKRKKQEGIGIPSIKKLVTKYNGMIKFNINSENGFFEVSILLPL